MAHAAVNHLIAHTGYHSTQDFRLTFRFSTYRFACSMLQGLLNKSHLCIANFRCRCNFRYCLVLIVQHKLFEFTGIFGMASTSPRWTTSRARLSDEGSTLLASAWRMAVSLRCAGIF